MRSVAIILMLGIVLTCSAALGAPAKGKTPAKPAAPVKNSKTDRPAGTFDSGAIKLDQMSKDLQFLLARKYGLVVNYVLPRGWEFVEQTREGKGKSPGVFATLCKRKTPDPNEPADFIFELDIFEPNILADIPKDLSKDKSAYGKAVGKRFEEFLNTQLSVNIKGGFKVLSKASDISPKDYGPQGTRPKVKLVPIQYQVPPPKGQKGGQPADLYTFTGLYSGHVWQLKFLVANGQLPNYDALIALILNNTFIQTEPEYEHLLENTKAAQARQAAAAAKNKANGKNSKNGKSGK